VDPVRGEVWDARLPIVGNRPAVVLTVNPMILRLSSVTVVVVTGTEGPSTTHVVLGSEAGSTRYDVSYANAADVHTVDKTRLRRRRGRLDAAELRSLETAVRTYLGL
jgi:mRNA interferase MazF